MLTRAHAALGLTAWGGRPVVPPSAFARSEADADSQVWGGYLRRVMTGGGTATIEQRRADLKRPRVLSSMRRFVEQVMPSFRNG